MAVYERDLKYEEAREVVEKLGKGKKEELIKYFIEKQEETIEKLSMLVEEYREVFEGIDKFLPSRNDKRLY